MDTHSDRAPEFDPAVRPYESFETRSALVAHLRARRFRESLIREIAAETAQARRGHRVRRALRAARDAAATVAHRDADRDRVAAALLWLEVHAATACPVRHRRPPWARSGRCGVGDRHAGDAGPWTEAIADAARWLAPLGLIAGPAPAAAVAPLTAADAVGGSGLSVAAAAKLGVSGDVAAAAAEALRRLGGLAPRSAAAIVADGRSAAAWTELAARIDRQGRSTPAASRR